MPRVALNGTEIYYDQVGDGPPCLVLHGGLGMDLTYLHPALDPLEDSLRLTYYDHRGNGRSGRPAIETLTFEQFSADADALRAHLDIETTAVLGHSYGSFIALDYALRYPGRVSRLILSNSASVFDYGAEVLANAQRKDATKAMLEALGTDGVTDDARMAALFMTIAPLYFHTRDDERCRQLFERTTWSGSAGARGEQLLRGYDLSQRLGEIQIPTLILTGADDFITPPSQARRLHAGIKGSQLAILHRSGHFPFVEEPEAYFATIRNWLKSIA